MTITPTAFARFFRRIPHPIPQTFPTVEPITQLLEWYNTFQSQTHVLPLNNCTPALWIRNPAKDLPHMIQELDATLYTAFHRPYRHLLYYTETPPKSGLLVRQWISIVPLTVVTFMEPIDNVDPKYWQAINNPHSTPPAHFWKQKTPPLALCQDVTGKIQWPSSKKLG